MAACIKIVLSENPSPQEMIHASLPSQTVVFRNSEPGRHPAFTEFMIQCWGQSLTPSKYNSHPNCAE